MNALTTAAVTLPTESTSPLQVELRFVVNLPPEVAFDLVAHRLSEWFTAIHAVTWDHSKSTRGAQAPGACSERSCDFGGQALREVIVSYEPGRRYSYHVDMDRSEMKMPLTQHLGSFAVEAVEGGSRVTWRQHFKPRWFMPGAMLRWQMGDRMMRPAVNGLLKKYGGRWER